MEDLCVGMPCWGAYYDTGSHVRLPMLVNIKACITTCQCSLVLKVFVSFYRLERLHVIDVY
jgi:hypothetical protein